MKTDTLLRQSSALRSHAAFEQKDIDDAPTAIEKIAGAFEAFRKSHDEQIAELKKGISDPVLTERLDKIEKSLDDASELKASIDNKIAAERKEREELEMRLQRMGVKGDGDGAKRELELKEFNQQLGALAMDRKRGNFAPLDEKGFDEYKAAQLTYIRLGKDGLSPDEQKAMTVGVDADGGYLVTPDVSGRIVKKVYETSPIRQIAGQQSISTDKLEGGEDLGEADAGWVGETETRSDTTTPQLGQWSIEVHELYAQPKASQKLLDDAAVDVEAWLANKVADKFARMENAAFVTGNGIRKPTGFAAMPTLADSGSGVAWGSIGHVVSGANGAFATSNPGDTIHSLIGLLKDAYLPNARFVTKRAVITLVRKFKVGTGEYLWQPSFVAGQPETLAGYPITRAEDIAALATDSLSLYFGDFREAYLVVDRQGNRMLRDPYTDKPNVRFYTTRRVGGGMQNFEAIKAMKFSAS